MIVLNVKTEGNILNDPGPPFTRIFQASANPVA